MTNIIVNLLEENPNEYTFFVIISDESSSTEHKVILQRVNYHDLAHSDVTPNDLVKKSFEFLLDREPKESILNEFDLMEIMHYFPEYKEKVLKH
jgi:hypothetical protein